MKYATRYCRFQWFAALMLCGCLETNFPAASQVQSDRILAIVATPPELQSGDDLVMQAMVVDAEGNPIDANSPDVHTEWHTCLSIPALANTLGFSLPDNAVTLETCTDATNGLLVLDRENTPGSLTARLPAEQWQDQLNTAISAIEVVLASTGDSAQSGIDALLEVGLPFRIHLRVVRGASLEEGETVLTGFKRVAFTSRAMPTTNPPAPRFRIGETWYSGRDSTDPFSCRSESETRAQIPPNSEVTIAPDENETWIETYPVIALNLETQINEESAYYSFFSTTGTIQNEITRRPNRNAQWQTPEDAGTYPFWVVVRDGHLGVSGCRAEVQIAP